MHHIRPTGKGDALCPLGFHPQVKWPTRCKRCFRDYKEHGNRNKEQDYKLQRNDTTVSSPSLSSWNSKTQEEKENCVIGTRSWTSISNLHANNIQQPKNDVTVNSNSKKIASSWTSTPNLAQLSDDTKPSNPTVSVTLPRRRPSRTEKNPPEDDYRRTAYTVRRRTGTNLTLPPSIAESEHEYVVQTTENKVKTHSTESKNNFYDYKDDQESDVFTDAASSVNTDDTETIVNANRFQEQIESLKLELAAMKTRCEKAEKEKNEMLMRRVASLDNSMSTKTKTSELSKLQEKINYLSETCDTLLNEKKLLMYKIQEFENLQAETEISSLKSKLHAAESLCEQLMDENTEMKRELRDMEEEIDEMQDNFRDNQADEYSSVKKELEQTGKNCRILSFKLRKCERKAEQLEAEKSECEKKSREAIQKLQKELDEVNEKLRLYAIEDARKKAPMLGNIPKTSSEKVSRASLTRGGSQEDPVQLLRDLQDSMEREADLREQLRYAEEEAENLRKNVSRVEDDNESFLLQLKKMATKAKSRKSSPTHSRLGAELSVEKDEGISDDDDPAELRLLLELNEQESAVLHKKIKELEETCDILKRKACDFQEKLLAKEQKTTRLRVKDSSKAADSSELLDLKNKLHEKERECIQLNSELNCLKRKSKTIQRARSVDVDQDSIDQQRQLKIVEQEVGVLRARICSLETENEKLQNENKQMAIAKISKKTNSQIEIELKSKIATLEKQLKDANISTSKQSNDKIPKEMVELKEKYSLLESENSRLTTSLKLLREGSADNVKDYLKKRAPKIVTDSMSKEALKKMIEDLECEVGELLLLRDKINRSKTTAPTKQDDLKEKEKLAMKKEKERLEDEKKKLNIEIEAYKSKVGSLNEDLSKKEEKNKKSERLLHVKKEKISNLEKEVDLLKKDLSSIKSTKISDGEIWMKKENELKNTVEDLRKQIEKKCDELRGRDAKINELEKSVSQKLGVSNARTSTNNVNKVGELEKKLASAQNEVKKLTEKIGLLEAEKKEIVDSVSSLSNAKKSEIHSLQTKIENLESEKTSINQLNEDQTKQLVTKDAEIKLLKEKVSSAGAKKANDLKKDLELKIENIKIELQGKQREYNELTSKYELLEDEHVKLKGHANLQKEQMQSQVLCTQKELTSVQNELRTLRETYNNRQDNWIREKLRFEDRISDLEKQKIIGETYKLELSKLKVILDAKDSELEKLHKENMMNIDQMEHMRRENEDIQKKLDDFDKVIHVQRNMVAEASLLESEVRELKAKLYNEEQGRKVEEAALKFRYENHVSAISSELKDVQAQVVRFKHERNTYKHLLENAQKAVAEARNSTLAKDSASNHDEQVEELRNQVATLEQQISCMEDEYSEARVECSRLRTELVSERSAWDVKLSEMMSKINELEEERVLYSGRTKTVGLKTRIELAWQKEREEQNRLLQETSTLARDLRQTLFEVERERDKERLEIKRRIEQMKKNAEEEQEEAKKKVHELQCDLLELRDAHAKLRTTNEKLRREKDRIDREKDLIKQNSRLNPADFDQKKVNYILDIVNELSKTAFCNGSKGLPPVPIKKQSTPKRELSVDLKNSSRESSLSREDTNGQFHQMLQRLFEVARQVQVEQNTHDTILNRDQARKAFISRRPASTESDKTNSNSNQGGLQRQGSLYRKCVSLEHTSPSVEAQEQIWRMDEDTDGSITSIQSIDDGSVQRHRFDQSFDSRLSGGSTHSELLPNTLQRKKKKGLFGKIKKLTKSSRSMDEDTASFPISSCSQGNPGSNSSISSNTIPEKDKNSKKDFKNRITNIFKSSDSRSHSMERASVPPDKDLANVPFTPSRKYAESQSLPRRTSGVKSNIQKRMYD